MTLEQWLNNKELSIDIWNKKYRFNNESFDEWLDRVSGGNAQIRRLILEKKFLFGGRILANRGLQKLNPEIKTTYSNCYVLSAPEDNLESIFACNAKLARTYSYGGGVGIDLSKLAPSGAKVRNAAKESSGAVSFMDLFSLTTGLISQNGRRGALMISMSCDHPDIEEFIDIKKDLDRVTKANISVRVNGDFMIAALENEPYILSFTRNETGETIEKEVNARELLMKLAYNNWDMGEPGILFWDRISEWNLLSDYDDFEYAGTNPCLTGDTLISTTDGEKQIKDLVGETPFVYCMDKNGDLTIKQASKVWLTRKDAQLVEIVTARGSLKCTPDHLIHTRNRGWVEAAHLRKGDKITGLNRQMKDETHVSVGLSGTRYVAEHRFVAGAFFDIEGKDVHHINGDTLDNRFCNLEVLEHGEHSRITNTDRSIEVIRDELGRYVKKPVKAKRSSFNQKCGTGTNWTVQMVKWLDVREDVYDMTVPDVHNFVANRMVVHNCAEEPLPSGGSCLLGSINLSEYVDIEGYFSYKMLADDIYEIVSAMNDVLDEGLELHPLQEQRDSVRDWRQIGIGVMGVADMLIKMHIRYGSDEAVTICEGISNHILNNALLASSMLAKKNGKSFPKYRYDALARSHFYQQNVEHNVDKSIREYGLYNSQLLTIAPTGTLSTMLDISGGLEPIFAYSYNRKTESLHGKEKVYDQSPGIVKKYMEEHDLNDFDLLPEHFVTAKDLDYKERIDMQAAWQRSIDASISSTVNLPYDSTPEDVFNIYMRAWSAGLKGITVFRDGCRRASILSTNPKKEEFKPEIVYVDPRNDEILPRGFILDASDNVVGKKRKLVTGCGTLHVTAFFDPLTGDLMETYLSKGSTGGCNNFMIGLSRMISLAARSGVEVRDIVDQLDSCGVCPSYAVRRATKHDTSKGSCCPMAVGNALMDMWKEMVHELAYDEECEPDFPIAESAQITDFSVKSDPCPECGQPLIHEGGCDICKNCGWSKCG